MSCVYGTRSRAEKGPVAMALTRRRDPSSDPCGDLPGGGNARSGSKIRKFSTYDAMLQAGAAQSVWLAVDSQEVEARWQHLTGLERTPIAAPKRMTAPCPIMS